MTDADQTLQPSAGRDRLESLVDAAQSLITQLDTLGPKQSSAVESGDVVEIVQMIEHREPLVRGLVDVGEEIAAFIQCPDAMGSLSQDEREAVLSRISCIEHTMKQLRERDSRDQVKMESVRDRIVEQMSSAGTSQNALRAYSGRPQTPNPILQDREG